MGTNMEPKTYITLKGDFLKNRALAAAGARFIKIRGSKLGVKINQKSIKKGSQHGKRSWHRFFVDFNGFWPSSWDRKSNKIRSDPIRSDQVSSGQIRSYQLSSAQLSSDKVRSDQIRSDGIR